MRVCGPMSMAYAAAAFSLFFSSLLPAQSPTVDVMLRNLARLSSSDLNAAKSDAGIIFNFSGIRIHWTEPRYHRSQDSDSEDQLKATLSLAANPLPGVHNNALGVTFIGEPADLRAIVFVSRVSSLANHIQVRDKRVFSKILGHAMAHEIGHLLMPSSAHCASGLMGAHWGDSELLTMVHNYLRFTDQESAVMRTNLVSTGNSILQAPQR